MADFSPLQGGTGLVPKESFFAKYKWWIIGGAIAIVAIIVLRQLYEQKPKPNQPQFDQPLQNALQYASTGFAQPYYQPAPMPYGLPPQMPMPPPSGFPSVPGQAMRAVPSYPTQMPTQMMPPPASTLGGAPSGFTPMGGYGPPQQPQAPPQQPTLGGVPMMGSGAGSGPVAFSGDLPSGGGTAQAPPPVPAPYSLS